MHVSNGPAGTPRRVERPPAGLDKLRSFPARPVKRKRNASLRMADVILKMQRNKRVAAG